MSIDKPWLSALCWLLLLSSTTEASTLDRLLIGEMANLEVATRQVPDVSFTAENGETLTLSDFAGKSVLVNFWAPWCAPCRKEMPQLSILQQQKSGPAFEVVTIAVGANQVAIIERFLEQIDATNLPLNTDSTSNLSGAMGMLGLPMTVLLDACGHEVARLYGAANWASPEALAVLNYFLSNNTELDC